MSLSHKLEDYEVLNIIGQGSFGTCYKVMSKITKGLFVWKAVAYGNMRERDKENLVCEVNLLSQLDHPNIVKYYDRILHVETTTLYIITEWCQGGDLAALIKRTKSSSNMLLEEFIWRILYQVSKAIQVCHTKLNGFTVLHRDIKPANVFLDCNGNAKLGDFGLARVEQDDADPISVGTPYYMSPEVVQGKRHSRKSDMWALGCIVYEMCALKPPFTGTNIKELRHNIKSGRYEGIPSSYSDNLKRVISFMLSVKHEFRPTVEMILHHPLVVMNIKSAPKKPERCSDMEQICVKALQSWSLSTDAEEITSNTFRDKWLSRLETLRERETKLKRKEDEIAHKERSLVNKEKQLVLLERQANEKLAFAKLNSKRRKNPVLSEFLHDENSDIYASLEASTVVPTVARIDPNHIKPPFVKIPTEAQLKHVHFVQQRKVLGDNVQRSISANSDCSRDTYKQNTALDSKRIQQQLKLLQDKENVDRIVVKPNKKLNSTFKHIRFI